MRAYVVALTFALLISSAQSQENWPQFRGSAQSAIETPNLPDVWSPTQNVAWQTEITGTGWSSPIVWGNRVFVTSVRNEGMKEPPRKGLYFGGDRPTPATNVNHWLVTALDFRSGKKLWEIQVQEGAPATSVHLKNTYASETPTTDGERVYAYFGNVGLFCLDTEGKVLWSKKLGEYKTRNGWGTASSPILHGDRLFIVNDNEEQSFVVALDKKTGEEAWRVPRDEKSNWSTPFIWQNDQRTELVTAGRGKVRSYDLDGKLLWEFGGMSSITIPTPFAQHGLLYICSGYVGDKVRPIFAVRPGASGDISLKENETQNKYIAWAQKTAGPYNPTPLVYGDYLYVLYDFGFLSCYDARTGKEVYGKQRLNTEGTSGFTASPWACHGKVFCLSEDGETFVVTAGPEFKLVGKNMLDEMCMASPAIVNEGLIIRTATKIYKLVNP